MTKLDETKNTRHSNTVDEASKESFPTSDAPAWTLGTQPDLKEYLDDKANLAQRLAYDHINIKNLLQVVQHLINRIETNQSISLIKLKQFSQILVDLIVNDHGQKEEVLYPTFNAEPKGPSDYMLERLIKEHDYGKNLLVQFHSLTQTAKENETLPVEKWLPLLNEIMHFYHNHLEKEEEYIFPHIHHNLNADTEKKLMNAFDQIEAQLPYAKETDMIQLAEELISK